MSLWSQLKTDVATVIRSNETQDISGDEHQAVLWDVIDKLGEYFLYKGLAVPTTNPGNPDEVIFYITRTAGTYTNFLDSSAQPIVVPEDTISLLKGSGNIWEVEGILSTDSYEKWLLGYIASGEVTIDTEDGSVYFTEDGADYLIEGGGAGSTLYYNIYKEEKVLITAGDGIEITTVKSGDEATVTITAVDAGDMSSFTYEESTHSATIGDADILRFTAGAGMSLSSSDIGTDGGVELTITATGGVGSDELVKISATDPLAEYLDQKVIAGTGITVATTTDAGGDYLVISSTIVDTNNYVSSVNFATSTGVLSLNREGLSLLSTSLDGRYLLIADVTSDYINASTFSTTTGLLSLTGVGSAGTSQNLDGRYLLITDYVVGDDKLVAYSSGDTPGYLTEKIKAGDNVTLTLGTDANGNFIIISTPDNSIDYINGSNFNDTSGLLSLTGLGNAGTSVNLDGRYLLISNYIDSYINDSAFSNTTGLLTLTGVGSAGTSVDLDGRYELIGEGLGDHKVKYSDIGDIAGYLSTKVIAGDYILLSSALDITYGDQLRISVDEASLPYTTLITELTDTSADYGDVDDILLSNGVDAYANKPALMTSWSSTFQKRQAINTSSLYTDMDDMKEVGIYYVYTGLLNKPSSNKLIVEVGNGSSSSYIKQTAYDVVENESWFRTLNGSSDAWSSWKEIAPVYDLYHHWTLLVNGTNSTNMTDETGANFKAGTNITLEYYWNSSADRADITINASGGAVGTDELVKTKSADDNAGYLNQKMTAGSGITITDVETAGNYHLEISTTGGGTGVNIIGNADNRIITGSDTADTLNAEEFFTFNATTKELQITDGSDYIRFENGQISVGNEPLNFSINGSIYMTLYPYGYLELPGTYTVTPSNENIMIMDSTTGSVKQSTKSAFSTWLGVSGGGTDEYVKIAGTDTTAGYLNDKLSAGTNITFTRLNLGGNEKIQINASASGGSNDKVKTDASDPLEEYLQNKIQSNTGDGITITRVDDILGHYLYVEVDYDYVVGSLNYVHDTYDTVLGNNDTIEFAEGIGISLSSKSIVTGGAELTVSATFFKGEVADLTKANLDTEFAAEILLYTYFLALVEETISGNFYTITFDAGDYYYVRVEKL